MSTKDLMKIVQQRGLRIELREGRPVLIRNGHDEAVTDGLLKVLKFHRQRIIESLKG